MTGYGQHAAGYLAAGWTPLPLPHGKKTPPPGGTTGGSGRDVTPDEIAAWAASMVDANLAVRLPRGVIGLDVDAYKPNGVFTMTQLSNEHGFLPATWRSSSKTDGVSGIYLYRVPEDRSGHLRDPRPQDVGLPAGTIGSDVEMIRWNHRYVVAAPSLHPDGATYQWWGPDGTAQDRMPHVSEIPELPATWLEALSAKQAAAASTATVDLSTASGYETRIVAENIARLQAMSNGATRFGEGYTGEPWDQTTFSVAARLTEVANADWSTLTHDDVERLLLEHAPRDGGFTDARVQAKITSARTKIGDAAAAAPTGGTGTRVSDAGLFAHAPGAASAQGSVVLSSTGRVISTHGIVDVTSPALAAEWLRETVGTDRLSGVFFRRDHLVYTPRVGEHGYLEPRLGTAEGAASLSIMTTDELLARVQFRYSVIAKSIDAKATAKARETDPEAPEVWKDKPALFPKISVSPIIAAPDDCPSLRNLVGVVHAPTFRPDGSLIVEHGYDDATGLLFLPTGGQPAAIPDQPTQHDLDVARSWIDYMLTDFRFVHVDDRANYIGLMLTPLIRELCPAPYKMGVIEAHQPGSGKSFLARAITSIHGGVFHSELPNVEEELVKTITAILDTQTSPVVVFDNVTGTVKSPALTGLLTSPTFEGRRLGASKLVSVDNDRLWVLTGNNASIGGDLDRRNVRVRIDPGMPNPELRTGFVIDGFERWVREHRGELLWSLLTISRHWVVQGRPMPLEQTQDSYGLWEATIRGILWSAGIPGIFDNPKTQPVSRDSEEAEWGAFLEVIWEKMGDRAWTARSLLGLVALPNATDDNPQRPIPFDSLPAALLAGKAVLEPSTLTVTLGRWLMNRTGRWANDITVREAGVDRKKTKVWRLERYSR